MKYSKLTIEQQNAIYPVFADLISDENLHGFFIQMRNLSLNVEDIKKRKKEELKAIHSLFDCVGYIYGATKGSDLQKCINQFNSQIPIFVDLVCSKEIQQASYTFEKFTDGSVWFNILNQKRKIYESLVNYHEARNVSQSK